MRAVAPRPPPRAALPRPSAFAASAPRRARHLLHVHLRPPPPLPPGRAAADARVCRLRSPPPPPSGHAAADGIHHLRAFPCAIFQHSR
ncbi:hypothetical protein U9M48_025185 [Paspalum notatum var. saurae]|uniref:Uncharacterized protein n=1 Tax=Paspalum notatum var. saurae TaxID=547442 RepID=A0AAQ3TSS0_PASNO